MTDRDFAGGFDEDSLFRTSDGGDQSTMTGGATEQSDDFENYEEETEELFLQMAAQAQGGSSRPANNNQISK